MPYPRHAQVSPETTPSYHCVSRCVRGAFLYGSSRLAAHSYEHRKLWSVAGAQNENLAVHVPVLVDVPADGS
ncbi:MAG: hypothetical protein FKY71_14660 [Spiribacter salinus]|uniref:Uncharacterized protein n=1 Tax=Spiribacter salinus TaxID=1335746 RepID=A0A540VNH4_9GAMM|nr:MAG: hypothetical protein FKY71_14660 [Spiribacter salinus]